MSNYYLLLAKEKYIRGAFWDIENGFLTSKEAKEEKEFLSNSLYTYKIVKVENATNEKIAKTLNDINAGI